MSVISMLRNESEFRNILKGMCPTTSSFLSNTPFDAFSSENKIYIPNTLDKPSHAGVAGTAADYMFRFIIAKTIVNSKEDAIKEIAAESALSFLSLKLEKDIYNIVQEHFYNNIKTIRKYIYGENIPFELLAPIAISFAYLDNYIRSGQLPEDIRCLYENSNENLKKDVINLSQLFSFVFIDSGIVKPSSSVIYNPDFGFWSAACGGADADIVIDGTLYDFKCTKELYKDWLEIAQIYSYYLLYKLCQTDIKHSYDLWKNYNIHSIALYKARYGVICRCPIEKSDADFSLSAIETFSNYILNDTPSEKITLPKIDLNKSISSDSPIWTTTLAYRDIPMSSCIIEKGTKILHEFFGKGEVLEVGNDVKCKYERQGQELHFSAIDFYTSNHKLYDKQYLCESYGIYHPKYKFGKIIEINKSANYTEICAHFRSGNVSFNLDSEINNIEVVRRPTPLFKSISDFPYSRGEKAVLFNHLAVTISEFVTEDNKDFVILQLKDGTTKKMHLGAAAISLKDEKRRFELQLLNERTRLPLSINAKTKIGERVHYYYTNYKNVTTHLIGSVINVEKDQNGIYIATIDFGENDIKQFMGSRF